MTKKNRKNILLFNHNFYFETSNDSSKSSKSKKYANVKIWRLLENERKLQEDLAWESTQIIFSYFNNINTVSDQRSIWNEPSPKRICQEVKLAQVRNEGINPTPLLSLWYPLSKSNLLYRFLNPFQANVPFSFSLEISENKSFWDDFKGSFI